MIIGRENERGQLKVLLKLNRNLLIEGPVGVGKTFLVREALKEEKRQFLRVDGDSRYTEQKLTGWFDPPIVLKKGYIKEAFVEGPLVIAMRQGKVLFVNELNRMPEAVQNILLPAMDERCVLIPKFGEIVAKTGFLVVATQNPREFTATHALSEALLDRFEMIHLPYQSREEELNILLQEAKGLDKAAAIRIVDLVRATREHASIKRGASIRAAIAVGILVASKMDLESACLLSLPSRVELISLEEDIREILKQLLAQQQQGTLPFREKKKETRR